MLNRVTDGTVWCLDEEDVGSGSDSENKNMQYLFNYSIMSNNIHVESNTPELSSQTEMHSSDPSASIDYSTNDTEPTRTTNSRKSLNVRTIWRY